MDNPVESHQVGDVFVHPDGGCTPIPWGIARQRREEPEEEPLELWTLDKATWGCSGPYADTITMPWELESWLLANPD